MDTVNTAIRVDVMTSYYGSTIESFKSVNILNMLNNVQEYVSNCSLYTDEEKLAFNTKANRIICNLDIYKNK